MNERPKVGLGVIIFNNKRQLLLSERTGAHGSLTWGPPGGHLEFGESFEVCAIRETMEETGLCIQSPLYIGISNDVFIEEKKHYISVFMKAFYPEGQIIRNMEPHKNKEWFFFDIDKLPSLLFLPLASFLKQTQGLKGLI